MAAIVVFRSGVEGAALDRGVRSRIPTLPARFARSHRPSLPFVVADLPQWKTDPVLVDTAGSYPDSQQYCSEARPGEEDGDKGRTWHEHAICGGVEALSDEFFATPPFLHLSGRSYAGLAAAADPARFGTVQWLTAHRHLLHVSELAAVARRGVELDPNEALAARLDPDALRLLIRGDSPVIAADRIFVAAQSAEAPGATRYGVHAIAAWERFLADTPLSAGPRQPGDTCLAVVGAVCFDARPDRLRATTMRASALGGASIVLVVLSLVLGGLRRARQRRREQEARLFVLQTLSHEIRTPATTLSLSLEPIRRRFDELPEDVQPAFLRLCDGVQRLQRVVSASTQYLRGGLDDRPIQLQPIDVASADELLDGVLDGMPESVQVTPIGAPTPLRVDPYWFGVCVRNLVDNALEHGAQPIAVRLGRRDGDLEVVVQDGGDGPDGVLEDLTRPFARRSDSPGLGFGLAVVDRLVRAMGGELRYEARPTRFTILLPVVVT